MRQQSIAGERGIAFVENLKEARLEDARRLIPVPPDVVALTPTPLPKKPGRGAKFEL